MSPHQFTITAMYTVVQTQFISQSQIRTGGIMISFRKSRYVFQFDKIFELFSMLIECPENFTILHMIFYCIFKRTTENKIFMLISLKCHHIWYIHLLLHSNLLLFYGFQRSREASDYFIFFSYFFADCPRNFLLAVGYLFSILFLQLVCILYLSIPSYIVCLV